MDVGTITQFITTLGFPIVAVIAMAWFIYQIYIKTTEDNAVNMEKVQARCQEREDKLYQEIKENREVNAKAIETIAKYAEKLEVIQTDVNEIKTDITIIAQKLN